MEKHGFDLSEGRLYICSECYLRMVQYFLDYPDALKNHEMEGEVTIHSVEKGFVEPCGYCHTGQAVGYLVSSFPQHFRKKSRERV